MAPAAQPLVDIERNGLVESRHRGHAVLTRPDGSLAWSLGDPRALIFPRSANKPFQALGMLGVGLPLDGRLLALASSSHSAESFHLAGVREILDLAGLDESALQTPASYPLDPKEHAAVLRHGGRRLPIRMDCSGKHAAMLLACRVNDWPLEHYLEPEHPVQEAMSGAFAAWVGPPPRVGVDGCGAPLFAARLDDLARGVGRLMTAEGSARRLREAMIAHPTYVSGTRRAELEFMESVPGAVFKTGAEAVFVAGLPDGSGIALKVEDGAERGLYVAMARILELAGVDTSVARTQDVLGGGRVVGDVHAAF